VLSNTKAWAVPPTAEATASELAVARDWYEHGRALQAEGHWALAAAQYRRALAVKDTPGLRYRLGHCEEQLRRSVEASLEYRRALELIALGIRADDVAALLPRALARLKQTTPTLVIRLPAAPALATLHLDGVQVASELFGARVPMNPGRHRLRVLLAGYEDYSRELMLREGDRATLDITPVLKRGHVPSRGPLTGDHAIMRAAVLSAELFVAIGGTALGFIQLDRTNALEKEIASLDRQLKRSIEAGMDGCRHPPASQAASCSELERALDEHARARTLMQSGFVAAGAGLVAASVTLIAWPDTSARLTSTLSAGAVGFAARGRF